MDQYFLNDPINQMVINNYDKKDIAFMARFYNNFKRVPFRDQRKIMGRIYPFIKIDHYQQYLDLLPFLTTTQKIDLIDRFDFLEKVPTQNRAEWSRWLQPNLIRISTPQDKNI